jgi:hypothetical protein
MAFSASDAALEGFHLARREPKAILGWSLVQLVFAIAVNAASLPFMRPLMALQAQQASGSLAPAQMMKAAEPLFGMLGALIPIELVVASVLSAAVYRAVLRPEEKGLARLRLGGDELRMGILFIELGFLFWIVACAVMVLFLFVAAAVGAAQKADAVNMLGMLALGYVVVMAVMMWLGVRLSLAGPMTFATRRVHIFSAWRLTRGRGWQLFGCYLLTAIFLMIILTLQLSVAAVLVLAISGGHAMGGAMQPDFSSLQAFFSPARIVELLANAIAGGLYWAVAVAPAAVIYRELGGPLTPER